MHYWQKLPYNPLLSGSACELEFQNQLTFIYKNAVIRFYGGPFTQRKIYDERKATPSGISI